MKKVLLKTDINSLERKSSANAMVVGYLTKEGFVIQNLDVPNGLISYDKESKELSIKVKMDMGDYLVVMDSEGFVGSKVL